MILNNYSINLMSKQRDEIKSLTKELLDEATQKLSTHFDLMKDQMIEDLKKGIQIDVYNKLNTKVESKS